MKLWKHTLITVIAFLGFSTTVLYTSCEQDSCLDLACKNGGSCVDGFCRCQTGYEGTECETMVGTKFVGKYIGNIKCNDEPPLADTVEIWMVQEPNQLALVQKSRVFDTLRGTAVGTSIEIPVFYNNSYRKSTNILVDNKRLVYYLEEITDTSDITKPRNICNFIGFK